MDKKLSLSGKEIKGFLKMTGKFSPVKQDQKEVWSLYHYKSRNDANL